MTKKHEFYNEVIDSQIKSMLNLNQEDKSKLQKIKKLLQSETFINSYEKKDDSYLCTPDTWKEIILIKNLDYTLLNVFFEELMIKKIVIAEDEFLNNLKLLKEYLNEIDNIFKSESKKHDDLSDHKKSKLKLCISTLKHFDFISQFEFENSLIVITSSAWKIAYDFVVKKFATYLMKKFSNKILSLWFVNKLKSAVFELNSMNFQYSQVPTYLLQNSVTQLHLISFIQKKIEEDLNTLSYQDENFTSALYIYLVLFQVNNYNEMQLFSLDTYYQFSILDRIYFVVNNRIENNSKDILYGIQYEKLQIVCFDGKAAQYLNKAIRLLIDNSLLKNDVHLSIFNFLEMNKYENYLHSLLNDYTNEFGSILIDNNFTYLKKSKFINKIINDLKKLQLMKSHFERTPFEITARITKNTPDVKLDELNVLFPGKVPTHCINLDNFVEQEKLQISFDVDEFDDNVEQILSNEEESFRDVLEQFHIGYNTKNEFKNKYPILKQKLQKLITNNNSIQVDIANYVIKISETFLKSKTQTNIDHFKSMNSVRYRFLFDFLLVNNSFDERTFNRIETELLSIRNELFESNSKIKYLQAINNFLNETYNKSLGKIQHVIEHKRSIVFKFELDLLLKRHLTKISKNNKDITTRYLNLQKIVRYIILFYSGMRPKEFATRTLKDIYKEDQFYYIDVNVNGCKIINEILEQHKQKNDYSLKNHSATRIIKLEIPEKYIAFVDEYYRLSETLKFTFLFTCFDSNQQVETIPIYRDKQFAEMIQDIRKTTNRPKLDVYSFRHSFVNYSAKKILDDNLDGQNNFINLANEAGHSSPDVMIRNYLHYLLLEYLDVDPL
jgi:hypothetical protein